MLTYTESIAQITILRYFFFISLIKFQPYIHTVCPGSSDPFYIVTYYIKWDTTSWTYCTFERTYGVETTLFNVEINDTQEIILVTRCNDVLLSYIIFILKRNQARGIICHYSNNQPGNQGNKSFIGKLI